MTYPTVFCCKYPCVQINNTMCSRSKKILAMAQGKSLLSPKQGVSGLSENTSTIKEYVSEMVFQEVQKFPNETATTSLDAIDSPILAELKTYFNLATNPILDEIQSSSTSGQNFFENTDQMEIQVQIVNTLDPDTDIINSDSEYLPEPDIVPANKSRKRQRKSSGWRKTKAKKLRNVEKAYINSKNTLVPERKMRNSCRASCRQKCTARFSENERNDVFLQYWSLGDVNRQRDFIGKYVSFVDKKRTRIRRKKQKSLETKPESTHTTLSSSDSETETPASRRKKSFYYHLPSQGGEKSQVCQTFFLNTLGISHQIVKTVSKKLCSSGSTVQEDKRGLTRHPRISEKTKQLIRDHISSFEKVESHYCRKDSSKEYLSPSLNISKMYDLYLKHCETVKETPASKSNYRYIFLNNFNLGFYAPKKDQCDLCTNYKNSTMEEKAALQEKIDRHIANKERMRNFKNADKLRAENDGSFCIAEFDLQQILPCPKTEVGQAYYKSKLATYNLTVFDAAKKQGYCFMWHEVIASRGCCEIGSCLLQFLKIKSEEGTKEIAFYSDNCSGQNRNKYIFLMFMYAATKYKIKITHNFFEVGHTQNEGDCMHSTIERASKHIPIYTPSQWYLLARTACRKKPYYVKEMNGNDFFDLKTLLQDTSKNFERDISGNLVRISNVTSIRADYENPYILKIRYKLEEDYIGLNIIERCRKPLQSFANYELIILRHERIPLNKQKYKSLLYFCENNAIPKEYQDFFLSLPHQ